MSQSGAKIILFHEEALVSILRDDLAFIDFPNFWDIPGGGIEAGETPHEALLREVKEELGLLLEPQSFVWERSDAVGSEPISYLFAAPIGRAQLDGIILGEEGQRWELMRYDRFCSRLDAVPFFRPLVAEFFENR